MPGKQYDFTKMTVFDFSNLTENTSSDNCYGSCNDTSCDIDCDCVCDADWGWGSFEREAKKEREMCLARQQARERAYSEKQSKNEKQTGKVAGNEFDGMSEAELLDLIQRATQALITKQKEGHGGR